MYYASQLRSGSTTYNSFQKDLNVTLDSSFSGWKPSKIQTELLRFELKDQSLRLLLIG